MGAKHRRLVFWVVAFPPDSLLLLITPPFSLPLDGILSVVTEPVLPVLTQLAEMEADDLVLGLFSIAEGLHFLHSRCKLAHNNLSLRAIFVSETDHHWRIGCLEHTLPAAELTAQYLAATKAFRQPEAVTPEEATGTVGPLHARDAYAYGRVVLDILDQSSDILPAGWGLGGGGAKYASCTLRQPKLTNVVISSSLPRRCCAGVCDILRGAAAE